MRVSACPAWRSTGSITAKRHWHTLLRNVQAEFGRQINPDAGCPFLLDTALATGVSIQAESPTIEIDRYRLFHDEETEREQHCRSLWATGYCRAQQGGACILATRSS